MPIETCMVVSTKLISHSISHADLLTNGPASRDNKRTAGYLSKKSRGLSMCSEGIMARPLPVDPRGVVLKCSCRTNPVLHSSAFYCLVSRP